MARRHVLPILLGALLVTGLGVAATRIGGTDFAASLTEDAAGAIRQAGGRGVKADFRQDDWWAATRHPLLRGGTRLDEATRARVARAVAAIPGVGGIRWADGSMLATVGGVPLKPLHCQDDVEALLRARTIRFEGGSSRIDRTSRELLDEVASALRPCLGSIIAIVGHTDSSGPEAGNIALSAERAAAVKRALINRGIPADGLRARGMGSQEPVEGLDPADPANRRIEFSVIVTEPLVPTPIDTPGSR